ncbi:metallophosphoesterase, partial [Leptospira santarosai]|nr:metallophosphoesterase [Leptospira santarosai]
MAVYLIREQDNLQFIRSKNPVEKDIQNGIDIIGDIHGCFDEMICLLNQLGYVKNEKGLFLHPQGRKFVSIGDVMSRGPQSLKTMLFVHNHVEQNLAYMIDSNHGWKI